MSFRRRLLVMFALTVLVSVAPVALIVSTMARRALDRANDERTVALVAQFRREFNRRGGEVARRIQAIVAAPETNRMTVAAAKPSPDYSPFLDDAQVLADAQRLDYLELADDHGTIISSAQWPAKFGYIETLIKPGLPSGPFLKHEETPSGAELGLFVVHAIPVAEHKIFVIGGLRLDQSFLASIDLPAGMRALLYENLDYASDRFVREHLIGASGSPHDPMAFAPIVQQVLRGGKEATSIVESDNGEESVDAIPLTGDDNQVLGVLLVGSSRQIYAELRNQIRSAALLAAGSGLVLAILLSSWLSARVTRPVEKLARAAHEVAAGNWNAHVEVFTGDEIGQLADTFNRMTGELLQQQDRLVQAERVAAWRELARRLGHELKNPLFPLQLTVENLIRSRELGQQEFHETFRESSTTLLAEISHLKTIVSRFSDFARMPQPQFQRVELKELLENVAKVYQAQLSKSNISCEVTTSGSIAADPDLLHRALSNLILNAIDAMPQGGTLRVSASSEQHSARFEVSDTGKGLTSDESARLFTPYYTSKSGGTGLGLAIVQSIVSDHGGRISVRSELGKGTTFIIELPSNAEKLSSAWSART